MPSITNRDGIEIHDSDYGPRDAQIIVFRHC